MPGPSYLDYNATAPLRAAAREAAVAALDLVGNPSSVHGPGRAARAAVEEARAAVAGLAGARPAEVVFTASATEANALCLHGARGTGLLASAGEHDSVLAAAGVELLPLRPDGRLDLAALAQRMEGIEGPFILSLMAANNETGVLQPLAEASASVRAAGGLLHCDAVQAAGRLPPAHWADADYVSLSAHKLGGPKGAGALVVRGEAPLVPLFKGGGQERRLRAGTENVAAIAGFGAAAAEVHECWQRERATVGALRDRFEEGLLALLPEAVIFGAEVPRLANTSCFALPGRRSETLLIALDLAGVAVSSGAACSSGKVERSHVLTAMGVPTHLAEGALRVSFGWASREEEVDHALEALAAICKRPRRAVA